VDRSGHWFEIMCNSDVSIVNFQRIDWYVFHFVQWSQSLNPIMLVLYMLLLLQLYTVIVGSTFRISHAWGSWHEVILLFIICFDVRRDIDLQKKRKGCGHFLPVFLMRVTHGKCFSVSSMQVNPLMPDLNPPAQCHHAKIFRVGF